MAGEVRLIHTQASIAADDDMALDHPGGKRGHDRATFFFDATTLDGTWIITLQWVSYDGTKQSVAQSTLSAGVTELGVSAPFSGVDNTIPEPTHIDINHSIGGTPELVGKCYAMYSD